MGARGNSGVILSQIIRGAAEMLRSEAAIDARVVAQAFQAARDAAYRAVREPVEGTMLSVIRELAEESENANDDDIPELLTRLVRRGEEAVARTPEQLAVLREAGVVDAGGAGLFEIVRGIAATVTGEGSARRAVRTRRAERRRDSSGALEVPLLHDVHDRRRRPRQRCDRGGDASSSVTRCSSSATRKR